MDRKIIIPLDGMNKNLALKLAQELRDEVWGFKVNDLLVQEGLSIISELKRFGLVFADAKLHDIPNTVANGIKALSLAGADLITVHASGGTKMLEAANQSAGSSKILAVTVLTSLSDVDCEYVFSRTASQTVQLLASMVADSCIPGIVCSPKELEMLNLDEATKKLFKVIPGIRPSWHGKSDDQQRTATPKEAIESGADLLVIGRPITHADNPKEAAQRINEELNS